MSENSVTNTHYRRALIRSWPRDINLELAALHPALRRAPPDAPLPFEKAQAVPALLRSVGASLQTAMASIGFEDADGAMREFRISAEDALTLLRSLHAFQPRLLQWPSSDGTPSMDGSPTQGHTQVPVPAADAAASGES